MIKNIKIKRIYTNYFYNNKKIQIIYILLKIINLNKIIKKLIPKKYLIVVKINKYYYKLIVKKI
jgi:hypothetical protein